MKKKYRNTKISKHVLYIRGAHKERERHTQDICNHATYAFVYKSADFGILGLKLKTQNSKLKIHRQQQQRQRRTYMHETDPAKHTEKKRFST